MVKSMANKRIPGWAATKTGAKHKRHSYNTIFLSKIKRIVVKLALWGLLPIGFASWLIEEECHD